MYLYQRLHRRRRRHARRCRILSQKEVPLTTEPTAAAVDPVGEDDDSSSNYNLEFVVRFCTQHWSQWVQEANAEMTHLRQEVQSHPSRKTADTLYNVEYLYLRLAKVNNS